MPGPLIQIDQLSKRFDKGALAALDSVTAHFNAGEVTGLVGPDGAGKTTLLRLIAGLLVPQQVRSLSTVWILSRIAERFTGLCPICPSGLGSTKI